MERRELIDAIAADLLRVGETPEGADSLAAQIAAFAELLGTWSRRMNLTGYRDPIAIVRHLVLPPMLWARLLPEAPTSIVDLGSGAGVPGIPLALRFRGAAVVLLEARERRHHFQRQVVRELGLRNVTPVLGRAEVETPRVCQLGVAQALAPLPEAAFHVKRWTQIGGVVAIPQSEPRSATADPDLDWLGNAEYHDPFANRRRYLWISRRIS